MYLSQRSKVGNFILILNYDVDAVFSWHSEINCEPNACRLNIYWITWEKALVIATEITNHPGRKMHHAIQEIIEFAQNFYDLAPNKMMMLEHYKKANSSQEDTYFQVLVFGDEVIRYEIEKSSLIQLLGKTI